MIEIDFSEKELMDLFNNNAEFCNDFAKDLWDKIRKEYPNEELEVSISKFSTKDKFSYNGSDMEIDNDIIYFNIRTIIAKLVNKYIQKKDNK